MRLRDQISDRIEHRVRRWRKEAAGDYERECDDLCEHGDCERFEDVGVDMDRGSPDQDEVDVDGDDLADNKRKHRFSVVFAQRDSLRLKPDAEGFFRHASRREIFGFGKTGGRDAFEGYGQVALRARTQVRSGDATSPDVRL